ncbi:Tetracenomycin polyketide synthesis O-methyltransferase TcmP 1 [Colletotrichum chlorophyti]|uniref:Tetracenomycin polyketide synthesis O-methyltransferase TcmP 1 n=1 Tax=Colletotrichum chlorophyti TaxID=708187 RepID=A0A1Q8S2P9_9PEZI|nr:Tetracenomycin polyketide synthesis O-methyltransferase TcmP 1 [Colletotrichum chlorophyti]
MAPSSSSNSATGPGKGKITLTGAQETLLLTLFARARDAESRQPILNDHYALDVVSQIQGDGYDFKRATSGFTSTKFLANSVAMRARMLDIATERFLKRNPGPATVLHLACGLDSRSSRVKWQGEGRLWIDADRQDVIQLRRQAMEDPEPGKGEYRLIDPNIHLDDWLVTCKIPTDRPVLILFEGLTMYLTPDEIHSLLRRIVNHFQQRGVHGEIRFDAVGSVTYFAITYIFNATLKLMGTRFYWYLDDPKSLEQRVPGLKFKDQMFSQSDLVGVGLVGLIVGFFAWLADLFGITNRLGGAYGYEF